jgi:hypothetical protein
MDFQRLFKRKEESPAPPIAGGNTRKTLNERDVLVREGELLDGKSPASLVWKNVGGTIKIKADKILGILEGRTRVRAAALLELYPGLFEKPPNPGAEYNIPLQVVVMQLEEIFSDLALEESALEDFDTPFGRLAREDEARFKDERAEQPQGTPIPNSRLFMLPDAGSETALPEQDQSSGIEILTGTASAREPKEENPSRQGTVDFDDLRSNQEKPAFPESKANPTVEELIPAVESSVAVPGACLDSLGVRNLRDHKVCREGHQELQELYLTEESLDGYKVADLILQLPRVEGVVVMLSDGAALGGALSGGLSEILLGHTPEFVKHLLCFTKNMQGGPAKFVTFSGHTGLISLTIGGDVLILAGHAGKNLPPGLRERLVATAQALNMIYGSQP